MIYLILAGLSSAFISVAMRLGTGGDRPRYSLLAVNYAVCTLSALLISLVDRGAEAAPGAAGTALLLGGITGVLFLCAFLMLQYNILKNGLTLTGVFSKLGVVVPTILGFVLFGEKAGPARIAGVAVTAAAVALFAGGKERAARNSAGVGGIGALLALLFANGMADGMSKFYTAYGDEALSGRYLVYVFSTALALCVLLCAVKKERPVKRDLLFGLLLGIPNVLCSRFLLLALSYVPASAAYPLFSCGTVLLTAFFGRVFFAERLTRRQAIALALVLTAVLLLNL